jgi:hypothetical protein
MTPFALAVAGHPGRDACRAYVDSSSGAGHARTWVSGVGDDVNPCSRTAPFKTFASTQSKTAVNGEINCLDPGGFAP